MADSHDVLFSSTKKYIATIAIDFGTTFSGFAFSFNKSSSTESEAIFMNKEWGVEQSCRTLKTPTCLLLKPDKSFHSFGYEAMEKYANELEVDEQKKYFYFERFKMKLHAHKELNIETQLQAMNGRSLDALDVFAHSMRYLKITAIELIRENTGDDNYTARDIQWVLTVPAIWTPAAKQFMREAAYKAGIAASDDPEQLMIALEPEAASLFCRDMKLNQFVAERGGSSTLNETLAEPGTRYMVVDIGGGTLDVTVHEVQMGGSVKEVHQVTGGPYGGIKVDEEFKDLLRKIFGARKIYDYERSHPGDWLVLMNDFEMKKRSNRVLKGETTRVRLPQSFILFLREKDTADLNSIIKAHYTPADVKVYNAEYLCLSPNIVRKLFKPVMNGIISHLKSLLRKSSLTKVKLMLLVGGFADSALLQSDIKKEFSSKYRVLVPQSASIAVVQGAVIFGKKPLKISARVMSVTYGVDSYGNFKEGIHSECKKFYNDEGIAKCKNLFSILVKENQEVRVGEKVSNNYKPPFADSEMLSFKFYTSDHTDVLYVTEAGVNKIGEVTVQSPHVHKGKDRKLVASLYFGGTEITAAAQDVSSGTTKKVKLDFLHKK